MTVDAVATAAIVRFGNDAELDVTENKNDNFIIIQSANIQFMKLLK